MVMIANPEFWQGKRVFITGHTGFKGSWLSLWLGRAGAQVLGFALEPPTTPSLFNEARVAETLAGHTIGDVRDLHALSSAMRAARPEIVLHLAAQPLVRYSYAAPVETYEVNVLGTVNVLESARQIDTIVAFVNVTTDKCYENKEWHWSYREDEPLGGHDPYSSSKACSELVTAAYRSSFSSKGGPWFGSGRAGNVIGGGDWALDRIIPDALRSLDADTPLVIRNPSAIRPWQHVLEPLAGYILLAEHLATGGARFAEAWNFGPADSDARPVSWILEHIRGLEPKLDWRVDEQPSVHEARFLKLDSSKARAVLGWAPRWQLTRALGHTVQWHQAWRGGEDMRDVTLTQIDHYEQSAPHA